MKRSFQGTGVEKQAELVAAEPGQGIPAPELALEQDADLFEQLVAGGVTGGIVDHLELVEIEVAENVARATRLGALHRAIQPPFEFAAIDQIRQQVVGGLVGQLLLQAVSVQ